MKTKKSRPNQNGINNTFAVHDNTATAAFNQLIHLQLFESGKQTLKAQTGKTLDLQQLNICARGSDKDRRFFERFPVRSYRIRKMTIKEHKHFKKTSTQALDGVLVTQLKPGSRMKTPVRLVGIPSDHPCFYTGDNLEVHRFTDNVLMLLAQALDNPITEKDYAFISLSELASKANALKAGRA